MTKKMTMARVHSKYTTKKTSAIAISKKVGRMLKIMVYIVEIAVRMIIHNVRERAHLESVVDSSAAVKNAQDLSGLATRVERE